MSERDTWSRSERYRTLGPGFRKVPCILVERAGRNGEEYDREDDIGEVVCGRTARGLLLLFKGFPGSEQPSAHIPDTGHSTRTQVPWISIDPHPLDTVGSDRRLRVIVWPDGEADRSTPQQIEHFDRDRH